MWHGGSATRGTEQDTEHKHVGQRITRGAKAGATARPRKTAALLSAGVASLKNLSWLLGPQSSANRYSKSVLLRLRAKPSSPSTSLMVCALRCWSSQIFSSTVPGAI